MDIWWDHARKASYDAYLWVVLLEFLANWNAFCDHNMSKFSEEAKTVFYLESEAWGGQLDLWGGGGAKNFQKK